MLTGTQLGEYTVGPHLDEGGMGEIYRAFKPDSKDAYVVKLLLPELSGDDEFRKRFEREAKLLQSLQHPNIIPINDFGQQNGMMYFVMPYIQGATVSQLIRKQHYSPATAWMILEPIGSALTYAHEHHVIHRDLKPANILVEASSGINNLNAHPYLADFGLSKTMDWSSMTKTGMIVGTPQYMAPEQVLAREVTARTDVYALGIVTYEMLLGKPPFTQGEPDEILRQQVQDAPTRPTVLQPEFPDMLEDVILKALAKDPKQRYESAVAFTADYWAAVKSIPLAARMQSYMITG